MAEHPDPDDQQGEGQDSEGAKDKDDKLVPVEALQAERRARQGLETQLAELRGRVEGLSARPAEKDEPKELSSAQIRQAVDNGQMTEAEAEEIKQRQLAKRLRKEIAGELKEELSTQRLSDRVATEMDRYKAAIPDVMNPESEQRARIANEFRYLVSLGHDSNDPRTELLAARAAFGPVEALEGAGKPAPRETHRETGGREEPGEHRAERGDGPPKDMPQKHQRYYQTQIDKGVYPDWKAVREEWNYTPKHTPRPRVGA